MLLKKWILIVKYKILVQCNISHKLCHSTTVVLWDKLAVYKDILGVVKVCGKKSIGRGTNLNYLKNMRICMPSHFSPIHYPKFALMSCFCPILQLQAHAITSLRPFLMPSPLWRPAAECSFHVPRPAWGPLMTPSGKFGCAIAMVTLARFVCWISTRNRLWPSVYLYAQLGFSVFLLYQVLKNIQMAGKPDSAS